MRPSHAPTLALARHHSAPTTHPFYASSFTFPLEESKLLTGRCEKITAQRGAIVADKAVAAAR